MWHIKIVPLDFGTVNCICLEKLYVENINNGFLWKFTLFFLGLFVQIIHTCVTFVPNDRVVYTCAVCERKIHFIKCTFFYETVVG